MPSSVLQAFQMMMALPLLAQVLVLIVIILVCIPVVGIIGTVISRLNGKRDTRAWPPMGDR